MSILDDIAGYKRREVEVAKRERPLLSLMNGARDVPKPRRFLGALTAAKTAGRPGLIAEIKKASPSRGLIRADFDPRALARAYEAGGATCLSVLTDTPSFQGSSGDLEAARAAVTLPLLRKDFMLDPYQVWESRVWGADCILIIMAMVDDETAVALKRAADEVGMDALVEVHDEDELDRAIDLGAQLIGINNRDLNTFVTDIATAERLAPRVPKGVHIVAESGLSSPADLARLAKTGVTSYLVGESLMRAADVAAATRELLAGAR